MAASMRTLCLLGLVLASLCASTSAYKPGSTSPDVSVKIALQVDLKDIRLDAKVYVDADVKVCSGGGLTILNPAVVKLYAPHLLVLYVEVAGVKTKVALDLEKVGRLVGDVYHVVLKLVEDKHYKRVKVLSLDADLHLIDLKIFLLLGLHL